MCGIFCALGLKQSEELLNNLQKSCEFFINRRGPDHQNTHKFSKLSKNAKQEVNFIFTASVLWLQGENLTKQPIITEKSVFLFNGDVFDGISELDRKRFGDTQLLFDRLEQNTEISLELSKISGPYAFIYFDKINSRLYFGCDVFGRRSLLIGKKNDVLVLSSVVNKGVFIHEVPPIGTFCIDLEEDVVILYPWGFRNGDFEAKLNDIETILKKKIKIIQNITLTNKKLEYTEPNHDDLKVYEDIKTNQNLISPFEILLRDLNFLKNVSTLLGKLENSIKTRILTQPKFCGRCVNTKTVCDHSTIGVLFSGGVDCTILAVLIDKFYDKVRPIDLINVAFERGENNYETPDRETSLQSYEELKKICPKRIWNFIEANISKKELDEVRNNHIKHLIYPLNRILDDSLGCALWFAGRGIGVKFVTSARVLIVGMGADELFGGYCKQRGKMKISGWRGLHESLEEDWENISRKNLARDDRVVSDHGRQLRTPYLDENVVEFARNLPCWEKTYPSDDFPRGLGEKILLRSLAYHLGLKSACLLKKRALQFGSRIANSKENAFNVSPRL
ncbi:asparagine synthetase domain-containing protein CG17486 [Onthophagus taurus]|uniref:asparagine synthetase domain-containing protein CG17486 n=1 Tax=Onthophagus taurus TaxID=166361 RepID=UPI0039BDC825